MTSTVGRAEIDRFRAIVTRRLGLQYENSTIDVLADVLRRRLDATRSRSAGEYLEQLTSLGTHADELRALADALTVGETFFFRNPDNFRAFAEHIVPERQRCNGGEKRLRILSAGCSTGEEAYTLAMVLRDTLPDLSAWDVEILGLDLSRAALEKASRGRYSPWSLRATPEREKRAYFMPDGRDYLLDDGVRSMVTFEERNLVGHDPFFWQRARYDVVFCRNVMMYFPPEVMRETVRRIHQILLPGGFLFLGHAETLRGVSHDFTLIHTHDTFYYQRREGAGTTDVPAAHGEVADVLPAVVETTGSWVDVIRQASERIASLSNGDAPRIERGAAMVSARPSWNLAPVLEAMRLERFADALELISALPADAHDDVDALLVRAALLTNGGRLEDAQRVCARLLVLDELNAGAHYLMALCREYMGDSAGATEHDQTAIYLDASFAMPHLHLGLAARRSGDVATARAELDQALTLLAREDASRLLLFGGGFSRETLLQLCRAELRGVEGMS